MARSWSRSEAGGAGRDRSQLPEVPCETGTLLDYRGSHPLAAALPVCQELLTDATRDIGAVFAVADTSGRLMWVEGESTARRHTERINFVAGADWAESCAGTNAPGTALVLGTPVQIVAGEHFNEAVRDWSCAAAPVRDPDSGEILGAVDITGRSNVASPFALSLARAAARAAEVELARRVAQDDQLALVAYADRLPAYGAPAVLLSPGGRVVHADPSLRLSENSSLASIAAAATGASAGSRDSAGEPNWSQPYGRVAIDPVGVDGYVMVRFLSEIKPRPDRTIGLTALGRDSAQLESGGRRLRLSPRHSEIIVLLALAGGKGMSAGQLAVELSLEALSTVAVRADMSRLRAAVGAGLLDSQPYRLRVPVHSDVHELRDLLAEGRVGEALDGYPGPLLPTSQAPGVVEYRMSLEQQLRGAVLGSQDPQILREWVNQQWGADDGLAWETLAGLLPRGSAQRSAAALRACALGGVAPSGFRAATLL